MLATTQSSEMYNTRKNFLITMHTKYRPIKERQIMGIDYDKLKYGNRKPRYAQNPSIGNDSPNLEAPKDSILRNQTSQSFRPQTNHSSLSKQSLRSNRYETNSTHQIDDPQKVQIDYSKYDITKDRKRRR